MDSGQWTVDGEQEERRFMRMGITRTDLDFPICPQSTVHRSLKVHHRLSEAAFLGAGEVIVPDRRVGF